MSEVATPVDQVVTNIESLGVFTSKLNRHVFKFEVAEKKSSFYVKRTNPGEFPVVVHPTWQESLSQTPIDDIVAAPFHEGLYRNSNLSHFPRKGRDASPHGLALAYRSKAALYDLLRRIGRAPLMEADDDVTLPQNSGRTEREALTLARCGQGLYRTKLLEKWLGRCSVTGLEFPSILRASHVKPWRNSTDVERLDAENGLLLTPNLDAAFDRGLITFSPAGKIIISKSLSQLDIVLLGIKDDMRILSVSDRLAEYLSYHNYFVFEQT